MSNIKPKEQELPQLPTTDLSPLDQERINKYVEEGLPGLYQVKEEHVARMLELYLAGKPYIQISRLLKIDKTLIMYMSQKFNWFITRQEYHHELEATLRNRIIAEKVDNQDYVLKVLHFYKKKLGKKIDRYLATDNESDAESVDQKEVAQSVKMIDTLERLSAEAGVPRPAAPTVGVNLGETGVTMTKNPDGSVDITPKSKTVAEKLKEFADAVREAEKAKK